MKNQRPQPCRWHPRYPSDNRRGKGFRFRENGRTKTSGNSGGQKGHKGKHFSRIAVEEKIAEGQMRRVVVNHGEAKGSYMSKYVIDLRFEAVATEHRFYGHAPIPFDFRPDVQYVSEIESFVATLASQGLASSNLLSVKRSKESAKGFGASGFEQTDAEEYRRMMKLSRRVSRF